MHTMHGWPTGACSQVRAGNVLGHIVLGRVKSHHMAHGLAACWRTAGNIVFASPGLTALVCQQHCSTANPEQHVWDQHGPLRALVHVLSDVLSGNHQGVGVGDLQEHPPSQVNGDGTCCTTRAAVRLSALALTTWRSPHSNIPDMHSQQTVDSGSWHAACD